MGFRGCRIRSIVTKVRPGIAACLLVGVLPAVGCAGDHRSGQTIEGSWRAWLESPGGPLPFGLEFGDDGNGISGWLVNDPERIHVSGVEQIDGRVVISIEHYDSSITAELSADGRQLDGSWRKTSGPDEESTLPFHATRGAEARFPRESPPETEELSAIAGRWSVDFESDDLPAVGLFETDADGSVTGTFMTATGDYRFLAGSIEQGRLRLSVFDGAHAFLFDARLTDDGSLAGDFWSRDTWHESWTAHKDPLAALPDAFSQTHWLDGADLSRAVFPDLDGKPRALDDPEFSGAGRLIVVFGSWCPNCNDLSEYLVELDRRYRERGLSILGLAFEVTGDFDRDAAQVRSYASYHGIEYPLLIAGLSDKDRASEAFPLIDRVRSFPTTIFIHGDGRVLAVHSGFTGPATGAAYDRLRARFEGLIEELLTEAEAS